MAEAAVCSLHSWARVERHWAHCCTARACSRLTLSMLMSDKCLPMAATAPLGSVPLGALWSDPTLPLAFGTPVAKQWWQSGVHGEGGRHGRAIFQEAAARWCHCQPHPLCLTRAWYLLTWGRGAREKNSHRLCTTTKQQGCGSPQNWHHTRSLGWSSHLAALELSLVTCWNTARGTPCAGRSHWHAHYPRSQGAAWVRWWSLPGRRQWYPWGWPCPQSTSHQCPGLILTQSSSGTPTLQSWL